MFSDVCVFLCVCSQACVLECVYLLMFFGVCRGVAVLTFALCAFGWEVHTLDGHEGCVQHGDICVLDAALLPALVRGSLVGSCFCIVS